MRPLAAIRPILLSLLTGLACSSSPAPLPLGSSDGAGRRADGFSADRAWAHLEALAAIGPRAVGTPGAAEARAYISEELRRIGLEVETHASTIAFDEEESLEPVELVNLEVTIPGESSDIIALAAPYDSAYVTSFEYLGVNDGGSGAALLLEIARVLAAEPIHYTIQLMFFDGEAPLGRGTEQDAETRQLGSTAAAARLASEAKLATIRLLLLINRVSDADLRIARDRFSHRTYREVIWRTAAELGHDDVFAPGSSFDAPLAGHRSFYDGGMRRTVAIVDPHFGAAELPEAALYSEDDTLERSSPESLAAVGEVVLASLNAISAWLAKIDRFSEAPVIPEPEPVPDPEPEAGSDSGSDAAEQAEAAGASESEAEPAPEASAEAEPETEPETAPDPEPEASPAP